MKINPFALQAILAVAGMVGVADSYSAPDARGFLPPAGKLRSGAGKSRVRRQRQARARASRRAERRGVRS